GDRLRRAGRRLADGAAPRTGRAGLAAGRHDHRLFHRGAGTGHDRGRTGFGRRREGARRARAPGHRGRRGQGAVALQDPRGGEGAAGGELLDCEPHHPLPARRRGHECGGRRPDSGVSPSAERRWWRRTGRRRRLTRRESARAATGTVRNLLTMTEPQIAGSAYVDTTDLAPAQGSTLSARGLVKEFRKRRVVNDVNLHVSQGEIVGLLGPNGAGKTTTFYMIVGLISPDEGHVYLDDAELTDVPMYQRARRGIGYLAQEPSIFRKLTVEENVLAILETMPLSRSERHERLETLLDELSIKHLRRSKAYSLSGGERRRLEITRALVSNPKFMLL